jgi:DNA-binding CsgD family transcriptional regulator/N-acetylneuraminic acid mutarotase
MPSQDLGLAIPFRFVYTWAMLDTDKPAEYAELSERELEILRLVATGASNKEIAQKLTISTNTVKVHLRNIFAKVGAASRTEAALFAVRSGLVETGAETVIEDLPHDDSFIGDEAIEGVDGTKQGPQKRITTLWMVAGLFVLVIGVALFILLVDRQNSPVVEGREILPAQEIRWREMPPMLIGRSSLAIVAYEKDIYAIGGETVQGVTGSIEGYDLEDKRWRQLSEKPTPVAEVSAAVIGGLIYVPGGLLASGERSDILEVYDPHLDLWEQRSTLPVQVSAYSLVAFEGRLYLFGGWNGESYSDRVFRYDPGLDEWSELSPLPTPRAFTGAAVIGSKIYVLGGLNDTGPLSVNEIFSPSFENSTDSPWQEGPVLPTPRSGMGVTSTAGIIYFVGGQKEPGNGLPSLQYLPEKEEWQLIQAPFQAEWTQMGLTNNGSHLIAVGGRAGRDILDKSFTYQAIYTMAIPLVR